MVLIGFEHRREYLIDVIEGTLMEQVRHRADEHAARLAPVQRLIQPLGPELQIKAMLERMPGHASEPLSEPLGIAVRAAR